MYSQKSQIIVGRILNSGGNVFY
jgi:hypothetical protein